jgi:hypothetical protein
MDSRGSCLTQEEEQRFVFSISLRIAVIFNTKFWVYNEDDIVAWRESTGCRFTLQGMVLTFDSPEDLLQFKMAWAL